MSAAHLLVRGAFVVALDSLSVPLDERDKVLERRRAPRRAVVRTNVPQINVPGMQHERLRARPHLVVDLCDGFAGVEQLRLLGAQHGEQEDEWPSAHAVSRMHRCREKTVRCRKWKRLCISPCATSQLVLCDGGLHLVVRRLVAVVLLQKPHAESVGCAPVHHLFKELHSHQQKAGVLTCLVVAASIQTGARTWAISLVSAYQRSLSRPRVLFARGFGCAKKRGSSFSIAVRTSKRSLFMMFL